MMACHNIQALLHSIFHWSLFILTVNLMLCLRYALLYAPWSTVSSFSSRTSQRNICSNYKTFFGLSAYLTEDRVSHNLYRKYEIPVCDVTGNHDNRVVTQSFAQSVTHTGISCKVDEVNNKIQPQNTACLFVAEINSLTHLLVNTY
jgi:hypothetical protein